MKIGKLFSVDLRSVWEHEADDFTSWLASNIDFLNEALDVELRIVETEKKIDESRFSIDILALDENGDRVIIENQLEKTDHTHLGQIITYAANMDAKSVIWIAKDARPEHISAINWLNEATDKKFYLVQVEALKIDSSNPAPFFSAICRPSNELKSIGESKRSLDQEVKESTRRARRDAADTLIVPGNKEGFDRVFIGEDCWYSVRLRKERIPQLKYIVRYQTSPISAITHLAKIKKIVPSHNDPEKYKIIFEGKAEQIKPIPIGTKSKMQSPAYCRFEKIKTAKTVDDLLSNDDSLLNAA